MRISIIGTGYVGLVTGACLADRGHEVICVDVDPAKVDHINKGQAPIHEVGLPELLQRTVGKTLRATGDLEAAVLNSDITFIAVGTPARDGRIDLQYVTTAAQQIGAALRRKADYHCVVVKSTVIPGTTDGPVRAALEAGSGRQAGHDFGLGMNPEFLTEGQAIADFTDPDRIVVGGLDGRSRQSIAAVYTPYPAFVPRIHTNCRTAEMIKYASNSVLATMISFSNEIGRLCSAIGDIDVAEVMRGVHAAAYFTQRRADGGVNRAAITGFLEAGCGFGGSCLPKDVTALAAQGRHLGLEMPMLTSVLSINASQPAELIKLLDRAVPDLAGRAVTVLGLAFKPDTDDLRESPAFPIIRILRERKARITAYDPVARAEGHPAMTGVTVASSLIEAIREADVLIQVTKWDEFTVLPQLLREIGRDPIVVDGRRNLDPADFSHYLGVGR
ncbi:MAG: UDP-glucose/GDP-mannose dehydrogenase family protein [Steroidobacteraceae bacterium]